MIQITIEEKPFAITKWLAGIYKSNDIEYPFTVIMRSAENSAFIANDVNWNDIIPADNYTDLLKIESEIKKIANGQK